MLALTEPVYCYRQRSKHLELAKCIQATLQQQIQKQMIVIVRWVVKSTSRHIGYKAQPTVVYRC